MTKFFLSSTSVDLAEYRQRCMEVINSLGHEVGRMETFGARPEEPTIACLTEIDDCDAFVGIYAHRYGHIPNKSVLSITEIEFHYAVLKRNKPAFCYFVDEDQPWPPKMIDEGESRYKLQQFKKSIGSRVVRDVFTTPDDLAKKLAASLKRYLTENQGTAASRLEDPSSLMANFNTNHNQFFASLQGCDDLTELLRSSLTCLEDITRTDYNQIFLVTTSEFSKKLVAAADAVPSHKQRYRVASFSGLLGSVVSSGNVLNVPIVKDNPNYCKAVVETKSELVVPVGTGKTVVGVMNSESEEVNHYSETIVQQVELLAFSLSMLLQEFGWDPSMKQTKPPWIGMVPRFSSAKAASS